MNPVVAPVAQLLTLMTFFTDILLVSFFVIWLLSRVIGPASTLTKLITTYIAPHGRLLAFVVALTAMGGSLFYSEVAQFTPCLLCWWQRIFMYPLVLLLGISIVRNDRHIVPYVLAMSLVGGSISLYHYLLQIGVLPNVVTCAAVGYSASCSQRFSLEHGYITIPMMALSAFVAIGVSMTLFSLKSRSA